MKGSRSCFHQDENESQQKSDGKGRALGCDPRDRIGFPCGLRVKRLPTMLETWVQSLGQEDPLEKEMATHFSILTWRISWTEEPGGLQSMELQRVRHH